jgi:transcriptional regulator with XRE-family HTH domain
MKISEVLRNARREVGLSRREVGVSAGLHPSAIEKLERGARSPTFITLTKLCGSLGLLTSEAVRRTEVDDAAAPQWDANSTGREPIFKPGPVRYEQLVGDIQMHCGWRYGSVETMAALRTKCPVDGDLVNRLLSGRAYSFETLVEAL